MMIPSSSRCSREGNGDDILANQGPQYQAFTTSRPETQFQKLRAGGSLDTLKRAA